MTTRAADALIARGHDTLGKLAFSIGQPGVPLVEAEFAQFANNSLGAMANVADTAILKRLVFEGHTMVLSQLREQVSNPDAGATRKLPPVEREAKMAALRGRLAGVIIERHLEPSHALLDAVSQQWEMRQLQYIDPSKATSREWELTHGKTSKQLSVDHDKLLVKEEKSVPEQNASTEMQVFEALRRRGVAYAFADVISWECHERYLQCLFERLREEVPTGYVKTSLQQVLKADRTAFVSLIRDNVPVRRGPDNILQCDGALMAAFKSYEVGFHLLPLPKPHEAPRAKQSADPKSYQSSRPSFDPYPSKGKGKSKKGGKGKNLLPKSLHGADNVSMDPHQRRLCFNYNLGSCNDAPPGAQCSKGWHLCTRRGCHAPHAQCDHDVQAAPQKSSPAA